MNETDADAEGLIQELELVAINVHGAGAAGAAEYIVAALLKFARLQLVISRLAEKQARKVVRLTWAIVLLTFALLVFTVFLSYDAYLKEKSAKNAEQSHSEKGKLDCCLEH